MHGSVTVHMDAPPAKVWELVSDITKIGNFSPETLEAEWLGGATGPAKGAKFRGHVKRNGRGPVYWTTCTMLECEPEQKFAFGVSVRGDNIVNTWSYELEPSGEGTNVTESFRLTDTRSSRRYWKVAGRARARTNEHGMRTTLAKIKAAVEA